MSYIDPEATGSGTGVDWANAYLSHALWDAGEAGTLSADHYAYSRSLGGTAETTQLTIDTDWVVGSYYIYLICTDAATATWSTSRHRFSGTISNNAFIKVNVSNVTIRNHQIYNQVTGSSFGYAISTRVGGVAELVVDSCIARGSGSNTSGDHIGLQLADASNVRCVVYNTLAYDWVTYGIYMRQDSASTRLGVCYQNTAHSCGNGIRGRGSYVVFKNNLGAASTTADYVNSGIHANSSYNASSDATAFGTNALTSRTFTFENAASDDFRLASGDTGAKDQCPSLSADSVWPVSDDILGSTRGASYDAGFFEYISAGGVTIPVVYHHLQNQGIS